MFINSNESSRLEMDPENQNEFLCRIAKSLYYGNLSSFDSVSLPLTELAAELYNEVRKENTLERLRVQEVAEMTENACVSTCSLVLAILYLERIRSKNPEYVEKVAPSELFLVSLLIASKFLHDDGEEDSVTNSEWAACSGLPLKTVNRIEKEFLDAIKWEIHIADKLFWSGLLKLERFLANQEGKRRGWYSYSELNILITIRELLILKEIVKYSALCVTCYATTMYSLISTALLAIRLKHFLLNCILYVIVNRTVVNNNLLYDTSLAIVDRNFSLDNVNAQQQIEVSEIEIGDDEILTNSTRTAVMAFGSNALVQILLKQVDTNCMFCATSRHLTFLPKIHIIKCIKTEVIPLVYKIQITYFILSSFE